MRVSTITMQAFFPDQKESCCHKDSLESHHMPFHVEQVVAAGWSMDSPALWRLRSPVNKYVDCKCCDLEAYWHAVCKSAKKDPGGPIVAAAHEQVALVAYVADFDSSRIGKLSKYQHRTLHCLARPCHVPLALPYL